MNKRFVATMTATFALALALPGAASAGSNLFLQLDESYTTSTLDATMRNSKNTFEIQSWSWGLTKTSGEAADFQNLRVTRLTDRNSPQLAEDVASGRKMEKAILTMRSTGGRTQFTAARYCFSDVRLTGFRASSTTGVPVATEEVTMSYGGYAMDVSLISPAGAVTGKVVKGWNVVANAVGIPPVLATC